ncbi:hypothetical protein ACOME3_005161 [Neoechinorhynchus agilis]
MEESSSKLRFHWSLFIMFKVLGSCTLFERCLLPTNVFSATALHCVCVRVRLSKREDYVFACTHATFVCSSASSFSTRLLLSLLLLFHVCGAISTIIPTNETSTWI